MTVPNLDAMSSDELLQFWLTHQRGRNYRELFPNGGKGTKSATWQLAHYASNRATAMSCRLRGEILAATVYEGILDRIYRELPEWAKW